MQIGDDCMFSGGIGMYFSDVRSIVDPAAGNRINPPRPITIWWIGRNVTILKGRSPARIASSPLGQS